jgi:hypothetical protein
MIVIRGRTQTILLCVCIALASILLAMPPAAHLAAAGEPVALVPVPSRPLSSAELEKINKTIADRGKEIRLNVEITTLLGLTKGDELLLSRGIAVKDETGDIHEFEPLADGKGYLLLKLGVQLNTIYWLNKDFALTAARSRAPGAPSDEISIAEAQPGASKELTFWAAFAHEKD